MSTWFKHQCLVCGCVWDAPDSAESYPENSWTPCDHFYSSVVNVGESVEIPGDDDWDDYDDLYHYDRGR